MKSRCRMCLSICILFLSAVLALSGNSFALDYPVTMKIGCIPSPASPWSKGAIKFAELVTERTKGKVVVKAFPSSQLGSNPEMVSQLSNGSLEFLATTIEMFSTIVPDVDIYEAPFLFEDSDEMIKLAQSAVGKKHQEQIRKRAGVRFLAVNGRMPMRNVISTREIRSLSDMKGLKIRVPPTKSYLETFKALKSDPITLPYGEVYVSLSQGLIHAMEGPLGSLMRTRAQEICKYVAITKHLGGLVCIGTNDKIFSQLTPEYQEIVLKSAVEAMDLTTKLYREEERAKEGELRAQKIVITNPDLSLFVEATKDVLKGRFSESLIKEVKSELAKYRK